MLKPPGTWRKRFRGQLKTWVTTLKEDVEPLCGLRIFRCARWRKDWENVSREVAQNRHVWTTSIKSIGDLPRMNVIRAKPEPWFLILPRKCQRFNPNRCIVLGKWADARHATNATESELEVH